MIMMVIIVVTTFEPQADDQKSGTIMLNSNRIGNLNQLALSPSSQDINSKES